MNNANATKSPARKTAANSTYLAAVKRLYNAPIYQRALVAMNDGGAAAVETLLATYTKGDTSEAGTVAALARIGR